MTVPVLVADSDPETLATLDTILTRRGFRVIATHDGGDALARFFESEPRLVVCHEELPVLNGAALCEQVKSQDSETRVVILRVNGSDPASADAIRDETGCDAVVFMPLSDESLDHLLSEWSLPGEASLTSSLAENESSPAGGDPFAGLADEDFAGLEIGQDIGSDEDSEAEAKTDAEAETEPEAAAEAEAEPVADADAAHAAPDPGNLPISIPIPSIPVLTPVEQPELAAVEAEPAASSELEVESGGPDPEQPMPDLPGDQPSNKAASSPLEWVASVSVDSDPEESVFGQTIPSPMSAFTTSVLGYVKDTDESDPADVDASANELPEVELTERVDTVDPSLIGSAEAHRVASSRLRDSLPEPRLEDLPIGPGGSLGLRGDQTAALPPGLPSAGDLSAMPLPRMLYELYLSSFTGVLTLSRKGDRRRVFLWGGFPVRVESKDVSENLGVMLLNSGRLTQEQYEQMEAKIRSDSLRAGDALRSLGLVSDRELLAVMRRLNEERMVNTFSWREGTYTFEARVDFADGTVFGEVHPLTVIWRGIHEHYDLNVLFKYFSTLRQRFIVATRQFSVHYPALGPFLRNLNVQSILSGESTFEQALRSDDSRAIELSQLLYFLLVTDMIKPQARAGEPPSELLGQADEEAPAPTGAADYRQLAAYSEKIATEYLRLKDVDHSGALRLDHDADEDTIDRAHVEASSDFVSEKLPPGLADDMLRKVREIHAMLASAREALKKKAQRHDKKRTQAMAVMSFLAEDQSAGPGPDVLYQEAQALMSEGHFSQAQDRLQKAIASSGGTARYWVALAQATLLDTSRAPADAQSEALDALRRGHQEDPSDVTANFELAKLLARAGASEAARDHLERVVQSAPGHAEARRMLAQLSTGQMS